MRFIQHLSQEGASQTDRQHARDKTSEPKTRVRCTRNTWRYESGTSATRCIKRSKQESKIWPWRSHFLSFICPFSHLRESKWSSRCSMSTFIYLNVHVRCMDIQLMGSACVFSFTSRFLMEKTAWNKNENEKKLSNLLVFSANIDFIQRRNLFLMVATVDPSHHDSNDIIYSAKNWADGQTLI